MRPGERWYRLLRSPSWVEGCPSPPVPRREEGECRGEEEEALLRPLGVSAQGGKRGWGVRDTRPHEESGRLVSGRLL